MDFRQYEVDASNHLSQEHSVAHVFGATLLIAANALFADAGMALTGVEVSILGVLLTISVIAWFTPLFTRPFVRAIYSREERAVSIVSSILAGLASATIMLTRITPWSVSFWVSISVGLACILLTLLCWHIAGVPARNFRLLSYLAEIPRMIGYGALAGLIVRGMAV